MLKAWISDEGKSELKDIAEAKHVAKVWAAVSAAVPSYIESLLKPPVPEGEDLLAALAKNGSFRIAPRRPEKHAPKADFSRFARPSTNTRSRRPNTGTSFPKRRLRSTATTTPMHSRPRCLSDAQ